MPIETSLQECLHLLPSPHDLLLFPPERQQRHLPSPPHLPLQVVQRQLALQRPKAMEPLVLVCSDNSPHSTFHVMSHVPITIASCCVLTSSPLVRAPFFLYCLTWLHFRNFFYCRASSLPRAQGSGHFHPQVPGLVGPVSEQVQGHSPRIRPRPYVPERPPQSNCTRSTHLFTWTEPYCITGTVHHQTTLQDEGRRSFPCTYSTLVTLFVLYIAVILRVIATRNHHRHHHLSPFVHAYCFHSPTRLHLPMLIHPLVLIYPIPSSTDRS